MELESKIIEVSRRSTQLPEKLYYVYSARIIPSDPRNIVNVFLYRLDDDQHITHLDGEVDSYEWRALENWKKITADAENNSLVPQGELCFGLLTRALELVSSEAQAKPKN